MIASLPSVSLADLADLSRAQSLVLTVNNRYARRIVGELSAQLSRARQVMALPDIMPLSAWLRQAGDTLVCHQEMTMAAHTLDSFGAQTLWQRIIGEIEADHGLLDVTQAARLAMDADRLMSDWCLAVSPEQETGDYQRFHLWRDAYRASLSELDAEDSNLSIERVVDAITGANLDVAFKSVILAGFNELSPRFSRIIDAMQKQGIDVVVLHSGQTPAARVERIVAPDPDSEWRLAAQWAAAQLQSNPQGRYAIVAGRLQADVVLAHRTLRAALRVAHDAGGLPYNVALARPLADWPLVRAGLAWLQVLGELSQRKRSTPRTVGRALLAGGCTAHFSEEGGRAAIDALWRKRAQLTVSCTDFSDRLASMAPELAQAWQACLHECLGHDGTADIDTWAQRFKQYLQGLGFPGQTSLDSHSYQTLEAFDAALDRLSKQTRVAGPMDFGSALGLLGRLSRETSFQPQRDPSARLDVLGLLESEGGQWDGVWVLGLTDEMLPAATKPNPLIPLAVLRHANAPRATPERELQWAQAMYHALLCCAPDVWVSHASYEGERELRPSPFIAALPPHEQIPLQPEQLACRLERLSDERGPAIQAGAITRGGIGVIDTQARNPLWAFVKYRLGASELNDYADMSSQNARGLFLHRAIEVVWSMIPDQFGLRQMQDDGRLQALIEQSVAQAAQKHLNDYGRVMKELEMARAVIVLHEWLGHELARDPFSIHGLEQTLTWSRGPLELTVRLDRVDELADGRLAVIDYKSGGAVSSPESDWARPRPVNLQLPFYSAVLAREQSSVAALVLAQLHAKKIKVEGLADGDYGFKGLASLSDWPEFASLDWAGLMTRWRQTIERLADEYACGVAMNQSLRPSDLDYCDVKPFLRLYEQAGHAD